MSKAVDEEKVLVEGVLDVLDVVLGAHATMEVLYPSELQDPSEICNMSPPAGRADTVVSEAIDA